MRRALRSLLFALTLVLPGGAHAAGTTPLALAIQSDENGQPYSGCLLFFFVAGTVATPQNSFQDFGLTIPNPNPLSCSVDGRVPMHWIADGLIHIRLTDAVGNAILDTTLQSLGPSSGGGGGGGGGVDPTAVATTGDIKFRLTNEALSGWVKLNGLTIGSATSGATQRANADTQNLFVYLWSNCTNAHCSVIGGRGSTAIADFNANKQITVPDMRDSLLVGRDCMESSCLGGLLSSNVSSGGGDGVDTPGAFGGAANKTIIMTYLPNASLSVTIPSQWTHTHGANVGSLYGNAGTPAGNLLFSSGNTPIFADTLTSAVQPQLSGTAVLPGSGTAFPVMNPFKLGSFYQKL